MGNDTVVNLRSWIKDVEELQTVRINLPLMADVDCDVLRQYGCAKENYIEKTIRPTSTGVFIVDADKRIRWSMRNSPSVGRNFYEVLRQLDALLMTTFHRIVIPSNW